MKEPIKFISWNVNGIRAIAQKNFFPFIEHYKPDILALQETKAHESQLNEEFNVEGYYRYYASSSIKKGYSGVAVYTKIKPLSLSVLGEVRFDEEGRILILEFDKFFFINGYFPNSQKEGKRLDYKLDFLRSLKIKLNELKSLNKHIIVCGDYNIAHKPIDLSHPQANINSPGYLKEEREWMDVHLEEDKMVDTFRFMHPEAKDRYTWWSYQTRARLRNIGWRIDYFCLNQEAKKGIKAASILDQVMGSDHCPIELLWDPNLV